MAQVGAFPQHHPFVGSQAPGRLAVTHINAINTRSAVLQQAIGESPCGDAAVQADAPLHRHRESLQARQQFFATSRDKAGGLLHPQFSFRRHLRSGLVQQGAGAIPHLSSTNQLLRLLA